MEKLPVLIASTHAEIVQNNERYEFLKKQGFDVVQAYDGEEYLRLKRTYEKERFIVVLLNPLAYIDLVREEDPTISRIIHAPVEGGRGTQESQLGLALTAQALASILMR